MGPSTAWSPTEGRVGSEPPETLRARVREPSSWRRPDDAQLLDRTWWVAAWLLAALGAAALLIHPAGPLPGPTDPVALGAPPAGVGVLDVFDTAVMDEVRAYRGPRRAASLVLLALVWVLAARRRRAQLATGPATVTTTDRTRAGGSGSAS
jgi:hypothetical protein